MAVTRAVLSVLAGLLLTAAAEAQAPAPQASKDAAAKAVAAKDPQAKDLQPKDPQAEVAADPLPDTWIFAGTLMGSRETFSGTLVASKSESEFEMKLGGGATCDGGQLKGDIGLVRLPEITCTDDRKMRALFVPQGGKSLKVFGHVGDDRFMAEAHLLGTEAVPEPKQTMQPKGPLGLPPAGAPAGAPR